MRTNSDGMRTLGLIGGTSWHSTIAYYRYINSLINEWKGDPPVNPPLLMYSLNVDLMRRNDWEEINQSYLDIALTLQRAGAEGIVLGCTELPLLIKKDDFDSPLLDTTYLHAKAAAAFIVS